MRKFISLLIALLGLMVVAGGLAAVKGMQIGRMVAHGESFVPPPATVTATQVRTYEWESVLAAIGSLQAVEGVMVTAALPGRVTRIAFESGTGVKEGQLLLQQDVSVERAEERAAQSELVLARKNYERSSGLLPQKAISKSTFDESKARFEKAAAQLDNIRATIAKKTIKAPFTGRLGIRQVNLGETLEVGQSIVSLQSLDPIYANFLLPQQQMSDLKKGLRVRVTNDALRGREIGGTITAINSEVDSASRNIRVQATLKNPHKELLPGMYVNVEVVMPREKRVQAIPVTAVHYAPYGDSVFVVEDNVREGERAGGKVVRQQFVHLGEKHGDFVAVLSGLKAGETVVSTGVFKLRNGQTVVVDNTFVPKFQLKPRPDDA